MWGVLFGRDSVDLELETDRFTKMVLRGILLETHSELVSTASTLNPNNADIERRLQRLEKIVSAGEPLSSVKPRDKKTK
jgi:hypothetical protein